MATHYSRRRALAICEALTAGRTLADACGEPGMPDVSTVHRWAERNVDGFAERFLRAREGGAEVTSERIVDALRRGGTLGEVLA